MIPNKSYCFLRASSIEDAIEIYNGMNGISKIGQNNSVIYLTYFKDLPKIDDTINSFDQLPPGLILIENFVNCEEEENLLKAVLSQSDDYNNGDSKTEEINSLKHRIVKHFGYEFLYGSNQVDPDQPLKRQIPNECKFLWSRLKERIPNHIECFDEPDQLTVNQYNPGQGIPSHVDTHSAFLDPLIVISLEGDVVMEFKNENQKLNVLIPQKSLLIMSGESRYDWKHGIIPRYMDIIPSDHGGLTIKHRKKRTSLTFRKLRRGSCNCQFPRLCDTRQMQQQENQHYEENDKTKNDGILKEELKNHAQKLEIENVHKVYDEIANHFSQTRHTPWPKVVEFIKSFDNGSIILDIGCGNGKYLGVNPSVVKVNQIRMFQKKNFLNYPKFFRLVVTEVKNF